MWVIKEDDKIIKKYPFKLQCNIWLYMHGWVFSGHDEWHSMKRVVFIVNPQHPDKKITVEEVKHG